MKEIIASMHISLDGFAAGKNGEMDWIRVDDEMFDYVGHLTENSDTALYGRKTFEIMEAYWPSAGANPDASRHDKEHSAWYNKVTKFVLSRTMKGMDSGKVHFIGGDLTNEIKNVKEQSGNTILVFGSPTAAHTLFGENLVDELYLFINPVLLGDGIPFFKNIRQKINLRLVDSRTYDSTGVVCLHYTKS